MSRVRLLNCLLVALFVLGCEPAQKPRLVDYRELGELRVATRRDILSFREARDGSRGGFEHDLLLALGEHLHVPVRFTLLPTSEAALRAVEHGDVHLAAAGLLRNDRVRAAWTSPIRPVDYVLVGTRDAPAISDPAQLSGHRIGVRPGSVPAASLQEIRRGVRNLRIAYAQLQGEAELLERVAKGELDFAAVDRLSFQVMAKYHPQLRVAMTLDLHSELSWAIYAEADPELRAQVEEFLQEARSSGLVDRIAERYFGFVRRLDAEHVSAFMERIQTRLPRYRAEFLEAGRKYRMDWRLIAAVAYQESQWDPQATSPTGVRGMMMLTEDTARQMGISDRLDAAQSILGGAGYLALLRDQLPDEITEPDRSWMAVAAYNVGMGHLRGAGAIARSLSRDHTKWMEMKRVLPLIGRPDYAARLQAGAGRGGEAVIMTESVRGYFDILARIEPPDSATSEESPLPIPVAPGAAQGTSTSVPPM